MILSDLFGLKYQELQAPTEGSSQEVQSSDLADFRAQLFSLLLPPLESHDSNRNALKTLISLNKESRPFFIGDNSIWSFHSISYLSNHSIWRS